MPVAGVDALTAYADDRVQRGKEGGAAVAVSKRRVAASDLCDVRAWGRTPTAAKPAPISVSRGPRRRGGHGNEQVRHRATRQRVGLGSPPDRDRRWRPAPGAR